MRIRTNEAGRPEIELRLFGEVAADVKTTPDRVVLGRPGTPLAGTVEKRVPPKATVVVLEEVPTAPSVQQIETLMLRNQKTTSPQLAKPVALPAGAGLGQTAELNQDSEKPLPVLDTGRPSKTYAMVINNASYSKETLNNCPKRCLLLGLDAFGQKKPRSCEVSRPISKTARLDSCLPPDAHHSSRSGCLSSARRLLCSL